MKRYTLLILTVLMLAPLLPFAEPTDELKEIDDLRFSNPLDSLSLAVIGSMTFLLEGYILAQCLTTGQFPVGDMEQKANWATVAW